MFLKKKVRLLSRYRLKYVVKLVAPKGKPGLETPLLDAEVTAESDEEAKKMLDQEIRAQYKLEVHTVSWEA